MMDKLNTEKLVGVGLIIGLIMAILYAEKELSMSIASGLVGYMGGKQAEHNKDNTGEGK